MCELPAHIKGKKVLRKLNLQPGQCNHQHFSFLWPGMWSALEYGEFLTRKIRYLLLLVSILWHLPDALVFALCPKPSVDVNGAKDPLWNSGAPVDRCFLPLTCAWTNTTFIWVMSATYTACVCPAYHAFFFYSDKANQNQRHMTGMHFAFNPPLVSSIYTRSSCLFSTFWNGDHSGPLSWINSMTFA